MPKRSLTLVFTLMLPVIASAQLIDATWVGELSGPAQTACILVVPGGAGNPLASARTPAGVPIDATIDATLVDSSWIPVANFSRADVWIEFPGGAGTLDRCGPNRVRAFPVDANTTWLGETLVAGPLAAGGWCEGPAVFKVNDNPAETPAHDIWPLLLLQVNSPDIDGDRVVNLTDIGIFAGDYFGPFHMRSDLHRDGVLNLSDIGVMAEHLGADCR